MSEKDELQTVKSALKNGTGMKFEMPKRITYTTTQCLYCHGDLKKTEHIWMCQNCGEKYTSYPIKYYKTGE